MKVKFLFLAFSIVLVSIMIEFPFVNEIPIKKQIANEVEYVSEDITIFEEEKIGAYHLYGFSFKNKVGVALFNGDNSKELLWVLDESSLVERAKDIWIWPISICGSSFYIFLSRNPSLSNIKVNIGNQNFSYTVRSNPSLSLIPLNTSRYSKFEYSFYNIKGQEIS